MNTPVSPPQRRQALHLSRLWDQASIYLPVLLMGTLALGSYWAIQNTPTAKVAPPDAPLGQDPDYFMRDFAVRSYGPQGVFKSEVRGTEARHYPGPNTLEVDQAQIRSVGPTGLVTTAHARNVSTNADQSEYILKGGAVVVREAQSMGTTVTHPRVEFRGEYLRIRTALNQVDSHLPVLLIRGKDQITADRMVYNDHTRTADLQGRVQAVLVPR